MAGLVPAISIQKGSVHSLIGITGTRPVMTEREAPHPGRDPGSSLRLVRDDGGIESRVSITARLIHRILERLARLMAADLLRDVASRRFRLARRRIVRRDRDAWVRPER